MHEKLEEKFVWNRVEEIEWEKESQWNAMPSYFIINKKNNLLKISPYNILWKNIFTLKNQMNATSATIIIIILNVNAVFLGAVQNVLIIFIF